MRAERKRPEHLCLSSSALVGLSGGDSNLIFASGKAIMGIRFILSVALSCPQCP